MVVVRRNKVHNKVTIVASQFTFLY